MTIHRARADRVRIFFKDNTSTLLLLLDNESVQDRIIDLCEAVGWDLSEVSSFQVVGQVYADEYGTDNA